MEWAEKMEALIPAAAIVPFSHLVIYGAGFHWGMRLSDGDEEWIVPMPEAFERPARTLESLHKAKLGDPGKER